MSGEPRANILPTYVVIDESGSMFGTEEQLWQGMKSLHEALHEASDAAAIARVSVIGFSDRAHMRQPLTDWAELGSSPKLELGGSTSYKSVFEALLDAIEDDIAELKASNYRVLRPTVFFLSDGVPNNEPWERARDELLSSDFKYHPNALAFGIGQANPDVIRQVASRPEFAFMVADGMGTGEALVEFFKTLTRSVVESGSAIAHGGNQAALQVKQPDGFINIPVDEMD